MFIERLISPVVPTLLPTDTGSRALSLMEANNLAQLPLLTGGKYTALVQERALLDWQTPERPLSGADFLQYRPAVFAFGHPFDALRVAHIHNLDIVPVVDKTDNYLGAITRDNLLRFVTENAGLDNPGGIIVLEIAPHNYSLAEIARICEHEDVVVVSSQLYTEAETGMLRVTLKTDRTDLGGLVDSFGRHGYRVCEVFGEQGAQEDMLGRYQLLMSYINM
jgi:acetoin utilization protein AcuB